MKIINQYCTKLIIVLSTIMLGLTGWLGVSVTTYCLFAIMLLSLIKFLFVKAEIKHYVLLVGIALACFVHFLINSVSVVSILIFLTSIMLAFSFHIEGIKKGDWILLKICAIFLSAIYLIVFLISPNYNMSGFLMLFFDNPNMTGIAICAPTLILAISLFEKKQFKQMIVLILFLLVDLYLLYLTNNRGSFITAIAVICFVLSVKISKSNKKPQAFVSKILVFLPIIVMIIYVALFKMLSNDIEVLGKPLFSGREGAWLKALEKLRKNPFATLRFEDGTLNMFLEGIARFGFLAMALYFVFLLSFKCPAQTTKSIQYIAYMAFFITLFQQSFESTLVTGSYTSYVWVYVLLGMASMKITDNTKRKNIERE